MTTTDRPAVDAMDPLRVLLVRTRPHMHVTFFPQKTMPLGLLSMAATLRHHGVADVRVVDGFEGDKVSQAVAAARSFGPHVIGITGLTAHAYDAMVTAHRLREALPDALICVGGRHFSAVPEETLRICEAIDLVVVGEGEETLLEVCQNLRVAGGRDRHWRDTLRDVAGLAWLESGDGPALTEAAQRNLDRPIHRTPLRPVMSDLSQLVSPAYDLIDPSRYQMMPIPWTRFGLVEASRGCAHTCGFCHVPGFSQHQWRSRPALAVFEDIRFMAGNPGWTSIHFTDESFGHDPAWVVEFCEMILARELKVELWAQIRLDDLLRLRPHFDLMRRAGFYGMLVGFESDDQVALDRWDKGMSAEVALEIAPVLRQNFEAIVGSFIVGDRTSTEADFERTWAFANALDVDVFVQSPLEIYPSNTPMAEAILSGGNVDLPVDYDRLGSGRYVLPTETLRKRDVLRLRKRGMARFYTDPRRALKALGRGQHARRQFGTMVLSGAADMAMNSPVPTPDVGADARQRAWFKKRHKAYAQSQDD